MGYSAWKIWWQPRRTARVLNTLDPIVEEAETLREENGRLRLEVERLLSDSAGMEGEMQQLRLENSTLRESNQALNNGNVRLGERLAAAENELNAARVELESRADTESQIREFDELLGRVEKMKSDYERRISSLKAMIKSMKSEAGRNDVSNAEELAVIDMDSPVPTDTRTHEGGERKDIGEPDSDWLEQLP